MFFLYCKEFGTRISVLSNAEVKNEWLYPVLFRDLCSQSFTFNVKEKAYIILLSSPVNRVSLGTLSKQHWVFVLLRFLVISSVPWFGRLRFHYFWYKDTWYKFETLETHKWNTKNGTSLDTEPIIINYFSFTSFTMAKQNLYTSEFDGAAKDKSTHAVLIQNPERDWPLRKRGVERKNYTKIILKCIVKP